VTITQTSPWSLGGHLEGQPDVPAAAPTPEPDGLLQIA